DSRYRPRPQYLGYLHLDLDLKNQATTIDLGKRTGLDPATGSREVAGTDMAPGTDADPEPYTLSSIPPSTGLTVRSDHPIDGSLRVRVNNIQQNFKGSEEFWGEWKGLIRGYGGRVTAE